MLIKIIGTGRALPNACQTSRMLDDQLGLMPGALQDATGVRQRFICENESQIDLAVKACQACLKDTDLSPLHIDCVIFGSSVSYQSIPSTAPLVMRELGIADGSAAAFDVNSTCWSFMTAFDVAALYISAGRYNTVLIVSSEIASRALPWEDQPGVAALFGDGAAAAVLRKSAPGEGRVVANLMRTYPSAYDACSLGSGGTRFDVRREPEAFLRNSTFQMNGKELYRLTSRCFAGFVAHLLHIAGWQLDEVDLVIPHQASPLALDHMARQVGIKREKLVDITRDYGNQVSASIPFALDIARKQGRLPPGSKVLFLGTSAGVSFGGMAMET